MFIHPALLNQDCNEAITTLPAVLRDRITHGGHLAPALSANCDILIAMEAFPNDGLRECLPRKQRCPGPEWEDKFKMMLP